jgi:predicted enzyme related to lactoylglutathione lyase
MPRPVHFEIPAADPERAIAFYTNVFGWTFQKWDGPIPYWMITTGPNEEPGINGGLMPRQKAEQPFCTTIAVASVDETLATVVKHGGQVALPKMPIPGVGWLAYIMDTEGIISGVMQPDMSACAPVDK